MSGAPGGLRGRRRHLRRALGALAGAGVRRLWRASDLDDARLGEALVAELDEMKGMAMKVGQILSYLDGLPEGTQTALAKLQHGASPMDIGVVQQRIEEALGRPMADLFDRIEADPVAAASIGQVHRGWCGPRGVAVKVQYPDVQQTLQGDMAQLNRLARLASMATHVDGIALVAELRDRVVQECDYLQEADNQRRFTAAFASDPEVVVPGVVADRSAATVLTTAWHEGLRFEPFCAAAADAARQRAARALIRFAWRSLLVHRVLNADPHPGNYLFCDDHVVFLDYGCVRSFDATFAEAHRRLIGAALDGDRGALPDAAHDLGLIGKARGFDYDLLWEQVRYEFEPYRVADFTFTRTYTARGMAFSRPTNPNLRKMAIPAPLIWILRMQYGLHAVLARLGATGDFRGVFREALEAEVQPM